MCHTDTNVDTPQPESVGTSSTVDKQNMDFQDVPCDRIQVIPDVTSLPGIWPPNKSTLRILSGTNYLYIVRRKRRYHPYKRPRGYFRRPKSNRQTGTDKKRGSHTKHKTGNNNKPSNCITSDAKALGPLMNIQDSLMNFGLSYLTESDYRQMREWESESEASLTVTSSNTQGFNNTDYQNPFSGIAITYAVVPTTFTKENKYNCDKPSQTRPDTIPSETTPIDETNLTADDAQTVGEQNKGGKCDPGTTNEKKLESDNERKNREVDITVSKEDNVDKTNTINDKFPEQDTAGNERYLKTDPDDDDELDLNDESVHLKNAEVCALLGFKYEGAHAFYEKLYVTLIDKSENPPGSGKSIVNTDEGISHTIGKAKDVAFNRSQLIEDVKKPNADLLKVAKKGVAQKTNHNTMSKDIAPSKIAKKPKSDLLDESSLKPTSDTTTVTTCKSCKHRKNESTTKQDENPRTDLYDPTKEDLKRYPSEKDSVKAMVNAGKGHSTIGDADELAPIRNQIYKVGNKSKPNELEVAVKSASFKETNDATSEKTNISIKERQGESMAEQDKTHGTNKPMVNTGKAFPAVMSKSEEIPSYENQIYKLGKKPESDHLEVRPKSEEQREACDPRPMSACKSDYHTQSQSIAKLDQNPGTNHNGPKGRAVLKQNNTEPVPVPRRVVFHNPSNKSRFEESATKMKTDNKSAVNAVNTGVPSSTKPSSRRQIIFHNPTKMSGCHEKSESVDNQKEKRGTASIPEKNFGTKNVVPDKIQLSKDTKTPKSDHLKIIPKSAAPKDNNDTISVKSNTPDKQRQVEVPNKLVVCSDHNYASRVALEQNYTASVPHRILVSYTSKKSRFEEGADRMKTYSESGNNAEKTTGTEESLSRKNTCLNLAKISGSEDKANCVNQIDNKGQNTEENPRTDININPKGVVLIHKETIQVPILHQRLLLNPPSKSRFEEGVAKTRTNSRSDDDAENTCTPPNTKPSYRRQATRLNPNKKSGYEDKSECVKTYYQKRQSESMTIPVENIGIKDVKPDRNQFDKFAAKPKSDNQQVKPNGAAQKTNYDIISVTTNKPDKQPSAGSTSEPNESRDIDHIDPTKITLKQNSTEPGPAPHKIQIANQSKKSRFEEGQEKKRTCDSDDAEKKSIEKPSASRKVVCLNPTQISGFGDKESTNKRDENRGSGHNNSTKIVIKRKNVEPVPAPSRVLDLNASKKSRFEEGAEKKTCDDAEINSSDKPSSSRLIISLNPTKRPMCADKEMTRNRDEKPGTSHTNSTKIVLKREYDELAPVPRRVLNLNQSKQSRFEEGQEKMRTCGRSIEDPEKNSSNKPASSRQIICLSPAKRSGCVDKDDKKRQSDLTNKVDIKPGNGNNNSTKIVLKRKHMETAPVPHRILHLNSSKNSRFEEGAKKVKINDRSDDNAVQNSSIKSHIICLNPNKKSRCEENAGCKNKDDRINLGNGNFIPPHKRNPAAESSKPSSSTETVSSNFSKKPIQKIVWQDTKPNCKDNITVSIDNRRTIASEEMKTSSKSRQIICLNPHKKISNVAEKGDKEFSESLSKYQRDVSVKSRLGLRENVSVKSRLGYIGTETSQDIYSRQNNGTDTYSPSVHKKGRRGWRKTQADTNTFPDMTDRHGSNTTEDQRKGRIRRY